MCLFDYHELLASLVPMYSLSKVPATSMPGETCSSISRHLACLSRSLRIDSGFLYHCVLSTSHQWFTCVQLPWTHLTRFFQHAFSRTAQYLRRLVPKHRRVVWKMTLVVFLPAGLPPSVHQHARDSCGILGELIFSFQGALRFE